MRTTWPAHQLFDLITLIFGQE